MALNAFQKRRAREADSSGFQGDRNEKASGVWPSEAFENRILGKLRNYFSKRTPRTVATTTTITRTNTGLPMRDEKADRCHGMLVSCIGLLVDVLVIIFTGFTVRVVKLLLELLFNCSKTAAGIWQGAYIAPRRH